MSLWSEYIAELRGNTVQFIETEKGFVSYEFPLWATDSIYVCDMYVVPSARMNGLGREMFEKVMAIGRMAGKKYLMAYVELGTAVSFKSMQAQMAVGLMPFSANNDKILMRRPLYE